MTDSLPVRLVPGSIGAGKTTVAERAGRLLRGAGLSDREILRLIGRLETAELLPRGAPPGIGSRHRLFGTGSGMPDESGHERDGAVGGSGAHIRRSLRRRRAA